MSEKFYLWKVKFYFYSSSEWFGSVNGVLNYLSHDNLKDNEKVKLNNI